MSKIAIFENPLMGDKFQSTHPYNLGANSDEILPADCPIGSSIWVADKLDYVFCNGKNQWYRNPDEPVDAGQPISALFGG